MNIKYSVDKKSFNVYMNDAIKCPKCGHGVHFFRVEKTVCKWCGNYVFKDKKSEFEYKFKAKKNKLKKE